MLNHACILRVSLLQCSGRKFMKLKSSSMLAMMLVALGIPARAQIYDTNNEVVETFAGSGFSGDLNGVGQLTMFNNPNAIVSDSHSNIFFVDSGNNKIKEITPKGMVSTFAGGGSNAQGTGTNVSFTSWGIGGLTIDPSDTLWAFPSEYYPWLYKITSDAAVTYTNFSSLGRIITGVCADSVGNIYFSSGNQIYRYATNGGLSVFAGSGNSGAQDGNGIFSSFTSPAALTCDSAHNIYVWDSGNYLVRRIDQSQNVTTIAGYYGSPFANVDGVGTNASFFRTGISAMCADNSGNIYFACGSCIRKMDATTNVMTVAGSFTQTGYNNGAGNVALFNGADGVCISGGAIFVADSGNQRIRQITFNPEPQVVSSANLGIGTFAGITITGIVGRTYEIQSSFDMITWTTRATVLLTSSPYLWIDQNPIAGNKFYQALLLP